MATVTHRCWFDWLVASVGAQGHDLSLKRCTQEVAASLDPQIQFGPPDGAGLLALHCHGFQCGT